MGYGLAVGATLLVLALRLLLNPVLGSDAPLLAFVLSVMLSARYGGLGPGLLATLLSVLVGLYFFLPPYYAFGALDQPDTVGVTLFVAVGILVSVLCQGLRAARENAEADKDEKACLLQEVQEGIKREQEGARRQRTFLRDMLFSVSEGRLRLCDSPADLPEPLPPACDPVELSRPTLRVLRRQVMAIAEEAGLPEERAHDLVTAVGEASMNAVVHAGSGVGRVRSDPAAGRMQVWVRDEGEGIAEESLPRATLERGYSSAGTMGHGFWMMLKTCDRIYLLTGAEGTTVVLEQDRHPLDPAWLAAHQQ